MLNNHILVKCPRCNRYIKHNLKYRFGSTYDELVCICGYKIDQHIESTSTLDMSNNTISTQIEYK